MGDKTIETWIVKDTDGEKYEITSDNWTVSCDGLKFFMEEKKIAHFVRWANYYEKDKAVVTAKDTED